MVGAILSAQSQLADPMLSIKGIAACSGIAVRRLLFPPVCLGCPKLVSSPGALCGECWPKLRFLEQPWCDILGTPFEHDNGVGAVSPEAIARPPSFSKARAAVAYSGIARGLIQDLKFRDRTDLAPRIAVWMARAGAEFRDITDLVVPVPLHRQRFFMRRFNQSAELARALADLWGTEFEPGAIERVKITRQQIGLGIEARKDNVRGAFLTPKNKRQHILGKRVLLIDDVYTTGATVNATARALKAGGAADVNVLTFARVINGDQPPDIFIV